MEVSIYDADELPKNPYEYYYGQPGVDSFILDLRTIRTEKPKLAGCLLDNHLFRRIGSLKPKNEFAETNLSEDYDIIIYINITSATKILD